MYKATVVFTLIFSILTACSSVPESVSEDYTRRPLEVVSDDRRKERVIKNEIIALGDKVPLRVQVRVFNDQALLVGEVETFATRERLEVIAARKAGVRRIFNRLEVTKPLPSYKGFADILLRTKVSFAMAGVKELDTTRIKFLVDRERIFLLGLVTQQESDLLVGRLGRISGVKEIVAAFNYIDS